MMCHRPNAGFSLVEVIVAVAILSIALVGLAHGISVALYNTGFGLMIAIPAMIFYRYYRTRVDAFLVELETQAVHFLDATLPRH